MQVAEFEKKAREYEKRANTAEQRAFIMSIVRVGAQMISSAIPAIAMAAGGPASMLASSVGGALSGQSRGGQDADGQGQGGVPAHPQPAETRRMPLPRKAGFPSRRPNCARARKNAIR